MQVMIEPAFAAWESFYVIVGSSGAALTGLQFVVIAIVADSDRRGSSNEIAAFGTPTVVHFCAVLFVSAVLSAPWRGLLGAGLTLGAAGLAGVIYSLIVARRARRAKGYVPVFEDWLFHVLLPLVAYGMILSGAIGFSRHLTGALFVIAAAALLLLLIGIHNAWDTVTFLALDVKEDPDRTSPKPATDVSTAA